MRIRLESNHPIATSKGFEPHDGKEHEIDPMVIGDFLKLGAWVSRVTGIKMDHRPGTSRTIDGIPHFFPRRPTTGVHCVRVIRIVPE